MPPKLRKPVEGKGDEPAGEDAGSEFSVSSPMSVASTASAVSGAPVTTEHLERIIEANQRSMAALIAALPSALAAVPTPSVPSVPAPKISKVPVPKWTDEEKPFEFFSKYEMAQKHNGVVRGEWGQLLQVYLSGKAQAAYAQVDPEKLEDYEAVKATMLESLGDTPADADRLWWTIRRQHGETMGSFYLRLRSTATRRFYGVETRDEVVEKVLLSRFLYLLSPECYDKVMAHRPKTAYEASQLAHEFEGTHNFSKRYLSGRSDGNHSYQPTYHSKREQGVSSSGVASTNGSSSGSKASVGSSSDNLPQNQGASNNQAGGGKGSRQEKYVKKERKPITCYGCGEAGPIALIRLGG